MWFEKQLKGNTKQVYWFKQICQPSSHREALVLMFIDTGMSMCHEIIYFHCNIFCKLLKSAPGKWHSHDDDKKRLQRTLKLVKLNWNMQMPWKLKWKSKGKTSITALIPMKRHQKPQNLESVYHIGWTLCIFLYITDNFSSLSVHLPMYTLTGCFIW